MLFLLPPNHASRLSLMSEVPCRRLHTAEECLHWPSQQSERRKQTQCNNQKKRERLRYPEKKMCFQVHWKTKGKFNVVHCRFIRDIAWLATLQRRGGIHYVELHGEQFSLVITMVICVNYYNCNWLWYLGTYTVKLYSDSFISIPIFLVFSYAI